MRPQARPNIQGINPYIPGKPIEEVRRELGLKGQIIKLASNENPLGPSPLAVKALRSSLKEINLYPDDGCFALSKRLAAHLGASEDQLIFGNGSVDVIDFIVKTFVSPGDKVVVSDKSFIMFQISAKMADSNASLIPMKNYTHDLDAMAAAVTPQTKVVYLDNPTNPSGTMLTGDQVKAFMKKVPESCVVVFDEAYSEYIDRPDFPDVIRLLKGWPNAIVLHTFSKIYGLAGVRVGYGVGNPELIAQIRKVRLPFNISLTGQVACLAALDDAKHLAKSKKMNAEGKKYLYQQFQAMGVSYVPSEGNFILIDPKVDSQGVFAGLQKLGVIVRPVKNYGFHTELRVTIGTPRQNKKLVSSLKKVLQDRP
jgi:histidinol-phosphate aminotransferase